MSGSGLAALVGAAAPGVAQGVGNAVSSYQDYQKDKALDQSTANATGSGSGMADAAHPVWSFLNNLTGKPTGAATAQPGTPGATGALPLDGMPEMGAGDFPMNGGARVPGMGAAPMQMMRGGVVGYDKGGVVDNGSGTPIHKATWGELAQTAVSEVGHALFDSGAGKRAADSSRDSVDRAQGQADKAVTGYQNGGVVRLNNGNPAIAPAFERGPALPVGPNNTVVGTPSPRMGMLGMENGGPVPGALPLSQGSLGLGQGITPAGTEGQILTMDAGGVVPDGFHEQQGISGVPMNGRGAALIEGVQAGQNIGHNLQQAWREHAARSAVADQASQTISADVNNPDDGSNHPQGVVGQAKDAVEGFFHHLFGGTLDDNHKPNADSALPGVSPPAGAAAPPVSVPPDGAPAPASGAGGPALPLPAGGPAPAAGAPPAGAAPAPSPLPAGGQPGPGASPQPAAGQPQPGQGPVDPKATQDVAQVTAAKQLVASDPNVQAGVPSKSPEASGKPHSLTPEYWRQNNLLMQKAVRAAAMAGEDPAKVYESLTAMRNAHFQGQVLKQAATAYQAFQNNDMKSVEQAIKNINYYLPNGQDIEVKKATAADAAADKTGNTQVGDLMHANPYYKMYGHDGEPQYTKIDLPYLQQIGTAALDPRTVQEAQIKSYSAQQEAQSNRTKAQGEADTGLGRKFTGLAAIKNANSKEAMLDVDARLKRADAGLKDAQASWYNQRGPGGNTGQPKISMASLTALQKQAYDMTNSLVQGQPTTTAPMIPQTGDDGKPVMGPDGKPVMIPNMSPAAGKQLPDPTRIPVWMKNPDGTPFSPEQQHNVAVLGGQIASANAGLPGMNVARAVELGSRITQQETKPTSHKDPKTGKPMKDFVYNQADGTAHIWMGNAYENVYLRPNVADEGGGGGPGEPPSAVGSTPSEAEGGSAGPDAFQ